MRALLKSCAHRFVFPLVEALWATLFATVGYICRFAVREWTTSGQERVLVLAPHPDDESLGCGGTMALHARAGDAVYLVIATDGGSSKAGSRSRSQMAGLRARETQAAAQVLGARRVLQLGFAEGHYLQSDLQARIEDIIHGVEPTLIYTTSCIDYHPEHVKVASALAKALEAAKYTNAKVRIYEIQVPLTSILTNMLAVLGPAAEVKRSALRAYETQEQSLIWSRRHALYNRKLYRRAGEVEAFWELSGREFCNLMQSFPAHNGKAHTLFRGLRATTFHGWPGMDSGAAPAITLEVDRLCGQESDPRRSPRLSECVLYTDPKYEGMEDECYDGSRPEHGTRRSSMTRKVLLQATTRAGGDLNPVVALALGMRTAGYALTVLCDPASAPIFARFDFPTIISGAELRGRRYGQRGV